MCSRDPLGSAAFCGAIASGPASTQAAAPSPPVGTKLIEVLATVRDKKGKIVENLIKDDFAIDENGQNEIIVSFAQRSDLPLTLGLLVDTSASEGQMLETERAASNAFFFEALRPDRDQVFLIHFDREVELLQDPTSSTKRLHKALDELATPQWGNRSDDESGGTDTSGGNHPGGWGGGRRGQSGGERRFRGGARLYDAIYLASNDLMKKRSGRKAVIVLGDGVDRGSKVSLTEALDSAQRADTQIYSIHIHPEVRPRGGSRGGMERPGGWGGGPWGQGPWGGGRMGRHGGGYPRRAEQPDGKKILQQMAKETGGGYFEFSKKKTLGDIYTEIADELRNEYLLGFRPVSPEPGLRKIKVTVRRKGCKVQAREGYFADVNS